MRTFLTLFLLGLLVFSLVGCGSEDIPFSPYSISGQVVDGDGNGIPEVRVTFSDGFVYVVTDPQGQWSKEYLTGTVTVKPVYDGLRFDPEKKVVTRATGDVNFQVLSSSIHEVEELEDIVVTYGSSLEKVALPRKVLVHLADGFSMELPVTWNGGEPEYDGNTLGSYQFQGQFSLPKKVRNPDGLQAQVTVVVQELSIISIDPLGRIKARYGTPCSTILPSEVKVTLNNFSTKTIPVTWNGGYPIFHENQIGFYDFTGVLELPSYIINPDDYKPEVQVLLYAEILSVYPIEDMVISYNVSLEDLKLPEKVSVLLEDDSVQELEIAWDRGTPSYDGQRVGEYLFTGDLLLPHVIVNSKELRAEVMVSVITYAISGRIIEEEKGLAGVCIYFGEEYEAVETDAEGWWMKKGLHEPVSVIPKKEGYVFEPGIIEVSSTSEEVHFLAFQQKAVVTAEVLPFGPLRIFDITVHSVFHVPEAFGYTILTETEDLTEFGEKISRNTMEEQMPLFILDADGQVVAKALLEFENLQEAPVSLSP